MWKRLFKRDEPAAADGQAALPARDSTVPATASAWNPNTTGSTTIQTGTPRAVHKEVVRISMRDTLQAAGIPAAWLRVEPLSMSLPDQDTGVHARIVVRHWDARLMHYAPAIQQALEQRILTLDPAAHGWLLGCSWQFSLRSGVPPELPPAQMWSAHATAAPPNAVQSVDVDVISGPTRISGPTPLDAAAREELERMMAERDAQFQKSDATFAATQSMKL